MNDHTEESITRLWNPNVAANWSILFSPIFGAWIHAKNWKMLNEPEKVRKSMYWVYGNIALFLLLMVPSDIPRVTGFAPLVLWYTTSAKEQINLVKGKIYYEKKSWFKPIFLGLIGIVVYLGILIISASALVTEDQLKNTSIEIVDKIYKEWGLGEKCGSVSITKKLSGNRYAAVAHMSNGDKLDILIENRTGRMIYVFPKSTPRSLHEKSALGIVNQILMKNKAEYTCVEVLITNEPNKGKYDATARMSDGGESKILIKIMGDKMLVTIIPGIET